MGGERRLDDMCLDQARNTSDPPNRYRNTLYLDVKQAYDTAYLLNIMANLEQGHLLTKPSHRASIKKYATGIEGTLVWYAA